MVVHSEPYLVDDRIGRSSARVDGRDGVRYTLPTITWIDKRGDVVSMDRRTSFRIIGATCHRCVSRAVCYVESVTELHMRATTRLIGALSDSSTSRYRRRAFILGSACFVLLSTLIVAYAVSLATLLNTFTGLGSWDPDRSTSIKSLSIIIAVGGFYFLDFSLNGLQASLRALILDRSPAGQQNVANAWQGRMTHLANIFGYSFGYLNLSEWTLLGWIGGGQFRKLAVLACGVMIICVGLTCYTQEEMKPEIVEDEKERENKWLGVIRNIRVSIRDLPTPVRRVCAGMSILFTLLVSLDLLTYSHVNHQCNSLLGPRIFLSYSIGECSIRS